MTRKKLSTRTTWCIIECMSVFLLPSRVVKKSRQLVQNKNNQLRVTRFCATASKNTSAAKAHDHLARQTQQCWIEYQANLHAPKHADPLRSVFTQNRSQCLQNKSTSSHTQTHLQAPPPDCAPLSSFLSTSLLICVFPHGKSTPKQTQISSFLE